MAETNREGRTAYAAARHLIVDIETLGLTVPAPVLSIGAVFLDCSAGLPASMRTWQVKVDPKKCIGEPDPKTLDWWSKQSEEARREAFEATPDANPFGKFLGFVRDVKPTYFWGKSHDFDFGHLGAQIEALGIRPPWTYWRLRDIRTIEGLGLHYDGDDALLTELRLKPSFFTKRFWQRRRAAVKAPRHAVCSLRNCPGVMPNRRWNRRMKADGFS